jgi:sugar (pentulose or hexulose) kinase
MRDLDETQLEQYRRELGFALQDTFVVPFFEPEILPHTAAPMPSVLVVSSEGSVMSNFPFPVGDSSQEQISWNGLSLPTRYMLMLRLFDSCASLLRYFGQHAGFDVDLVVTVGGGSRNLEIRRSLAAGFNASVLQLEIGPKMAALGTALHAATIIGGGNIVHFSLTGLQSPELVSSPPMDRIPSIEAAQRVVDWITRTAPPASGKAA